MTKSGARLIKINVRHHRKIKCRKSGQSIRIEKGINKI